MKKELKKNLVALGLATSLSLSNVGCGEEDVKVSVDTQVDEVPTMEGSEEKHGVYKTEDYFLIYLNDQIYCTTRDIDSGRDKDYHDGDFYVPAYKYYEVNSGELIGVVIQDVPESYAKDTSVGYCYDHFYCDGEYGLGKIIPRQSVIPVSDILSSNYFTQEEFDFLSSQSPECIETILNSLVFSYCDGRDNLQIYSGLITDTYEKIDSQQVSLTKFICQTEEGLEETFLDYRCSYDETSNGYQYVYDILTGSLHYIGKAKENSYVNVIVKPSKKANDKSVSELQKEFILSNDVVEEQGEILENGMSGTSFDDLESTEEVVYAKDIYILDTNDDNADYVSKIGNVKKYYVLMNTFQKDGELLIFKDLINEGSANITLDGKNSHYISYDASEIVGTTYSSFNDTPNASNALKTFDEFLIAHDMEDFIHENGQYQMSEIMEIASYIDSLNYETGRKLTPDFE